MPWTYNEDLTQPKDQVRFLIQDTHPERPLVQDTEIAFLLAQEGGNVWQAAARGLEVAASAFSRYRSRTVGDVTVVYFTPAEASARADSYRRRGLYAQVPTAGGISLADIEVLRQNSDWPSLPVALGTMDNPRAGSMVDPLRTPGLGITTP